MVRPARRTALAVSAAAVALTASSSGSGHSSVEAFHPPAVALPQHKHLHHHHSASDAPIHAQSDAPPLTSASANACISRQRRRAAGSFSPLAVSASTSLDGESAENGGNPNTNSADTLQNMALNTAESALNTLSSAADQVVTAVSEDSDYVDEYEVEQAELAKRREAAAREAARRRNQYEITVPIVSSSSNAKSAAAKASQRTVGLTLRQITAEGQISSSALDFDSTRLISNLSTEEEMDPTLREGDGSVEILGAMLEDNTMANAGGSGKAGVIVSSVVRDGAAWEAGVRPGDVILATSATVGQVRTTSLAFTVDI